jgi:two-component system sensor histidine kinase HydH
MSAKAVKNTERDSALLQALGEALTPGVLIVHPTGQVDVCTPEARRLLGMPEAAAAAPVPALPDFISRIVREAVGAKKPWHTEFQYAPEHQPPRRLKISAHCLGGENASPPVLITLGDITPFTRVQENLERLNRLAAAGTLAAGMAHEIKNALVAVKTFLDLLLEQNPDAELAGLVKREMDRINQIVRQLLKFGSAAPAVHAPVRLHDVLEHSLRMVQHQLDGKLISLRRTFAATPDAVTGDNHQLEQVFVNLFLNAVDASGPNGLLTVQTEFIAAASAEVARPQFIGQPHVCVTVADTGAGIAPEHLPQVFHPFFTTKNHGTGLGLPITRQIIEDHSGQITVESQPNRGTVFRVTLPAGPVAPDRS